MLQYPHCEDPNPHCEYPHNEDPNPHSEDFSIDMYNIPTVRIQNPYCEYPHVGDPNPHREDCPNVGIFSMDSTQREYPYDE